MKKTNFLYYLIFIIGVSFAMTSCSGDDSCKTCTFDGDTQEICEEDLAEFNIDTGLDVTTLDELTQLISLLGGTCD